jgi:hypothetical protein
MVPGRIVGCYVVGSTALGAYRPGRSDVDLVVVVDGDVDLPVVRRAQLRSGLLTGTTALRRARTPMAGTVNGVYVRQADLARPVSQIVPLALAAGYRFHVGGAGSDVSPVAWKTFAEHGIALRGPDPSALGLDPEPSTLVDWNRGNLASYWRPWAARTRRRPLRFRLEPRDQTAWGVLGAPRLLRTIRTGDVVSKEAAGEYALDVMGAEWHDLVGEALAYWRGEPRRLPRDPVRRARRTADFVDAVIDASP